VPQVPIPLESVLGKIGHDVILEPACGFEVAGAAMRALLGTEFVFDEDGAGRRLKPKGSGVPAMLLAAAVGSRIAGMDRRTA